MKDERPSARTLLPTPICLLFTAYCLLRLRLLLSGGWLFGALLLLGRNALRFLARCPLLEKRLGLRTEKLQHRATPPR